MAQDLATIIALQNGIELPEFSYTNPHTFFELLESHLDSLKIIDAEQKVAHLVKKLPSDIVIVVRPIIRDASLTDEQRYNEIKAATLNHLKKDNDSQYNLLIELKKNPDTTYTQFLRKLQSVARTCGKENDAVLIKNRFLGGINNDFHYNMAKTMIKKTLLKRLPTH